MLRFESDGLETALQIDTRSMTDRENHPSAGRRRKHKSPPISRHMRDLPFLALLDHVGAGDGPSCSEEENDVKRLRSVSTRPE